MTKGLESLRDLGRSWGVVGNLCHNEYVHNAQNSVYNTSRNIATYSKNGYTNTNTKTNTKTNTYTNTNTHTNTKTDTKTYTKTDTKTYTKIDTQTDPESGDKKTKIKNLKKDKKETFVFLDPNMEIPVAPLQAQCREEKPVPAAVEKNDFCFSFSQVEERCQTWETDPKGRDFSRSLSERTNTVDLFADICNDINLRLKIEVNRWTAKDVRELVTEYGEYLFYYGVGKALKKKIPRLNYVRGVLRNLKVEEREKAADMVGLMPDHSPSQQHIPRHLWAPPWDRERGEYGPSSAICQRAKLIFGTEHVTSEQIRGLMGLAGGCDITEAMEQYYGMNWRNLDGIYKRI